MQQHRILLGLLGDDKLDHEHISDYLGLFPTRTTTAGEYADGGIRCASSTWEYEEQGSEDCKLDELISQLYQTLNTRKPQLRRLAGEYECCLAIAVSVCGDQAYASWGISPAVLSMLSELGLPVEFTVDPISGCCISEECGGGCDASSEPVFEEGDKHPEPWQRYTIAFAVVTKEELDHQHITDCLGFSPTDTSTAGEWRIPGRLRCVNSVWQYRITGLDDDLPLEELISELYETLGARKAQLCRLSEQYECDLSIGVFPCGDQEYACWTFSPAELNMLSELDLPVGISVYPGCPVSEENDDDD